MIVKTIGCTEQILVPNGKGSKEVYFTGYVIYISHNDMCSLTVLKVNNDSIFFRCIYVLQNNIFPGDVQDG